VVEATQPPNLSKAETTEVRFQLRVKSTRLENPKLSCLPVAATSDITACGGAAAQLRGGVRAAGGVEGRAAAALRAARAPAVRAHRVQAAQGAQLVAPHPPPSLINTVATGNADVMMLQSLLMLI
jgi:hypothetical protein